MRKEDVQIGMKVVPFQKTTWSELSDSEVWKQAVREKIYYLYVTGFDEDENCFVLDNENKLDEHGGDFYNPEDFKPYIEGSGYLIKICPYCGQEITIE